MPSEYVPMLALAATALAIGWAMTAMRLAASQDHIERMNTLLSDARDRSDFWRDTAHAAADDLMDVCDLALASEAQAARIADMEEALEQAAEWFRQYAEGHAAKGDDDKCARNRSREAHCRAALTKEQKP